MFFVNAKPSMEAAMTDMPKHKAAIHVINTSVTLQAMLVVTMAFLMGWALAVNEDKRIAHQDKINQEQLTWKK